MAQPTPVARPLPEIDYQVARNRMVERDLVAAGITDPRILDAFLKVPRDRFAHHEAMRLRAYDNTAIPIGLGQTLSAAATQARMTAALHLQPEHRVLEIGTGSGYQTAILAELARRVFTIERHPELGARALELLRSLGYATIQARIGDGSMGWAERAPFDRILVTACAPGPLAALLEQLSPGGILVTPQAGAGPQQRLLRLRKAGRALEREDLGPCQFVPLVGRAGYAELSREPEPPLARVARRRSRARP
jgi:protein-L-isoaspartate(D-aspartate) O-methyltransferase